LYRYWLLVRFQPTAGQHETSQSSYYRFGVKQLSSVRTFVKYTSHGNADLRQHKRSTFITLCVETLGLRPLHPSSNTPSRMTEGASETSVVYQTARRHVPLHFVLQILVSRKKKRLSSVLRTRPKQPAPFSLATYDTLQTRRCVCVCVCTANGAYSSMTWLNMN